MLGNIKGDWLNGWWGVPIQEKNKTCSEENEDHGGKKSLKNKKKTKKKKTMCFLDVLGENKTLLKLFMNYVATNLNMFCSFMKSWIDCYMKSWFVITIK